MHVVTFHHCVCILSMCIQFICLLFCVNTSGHDVMMEGSEDLFGPESVRPNTDLQLGSDSETPELFPLDPQPTIISPQPPTPPLSSHRASPGGKAIQAHAQFLQSLCSLHRVKGNDRGLESLWFRPDDDAGSVLVDSVCQLLDSIVAACRDPPLLGPCDLILQACQVAAQAMDLFCSQRLPSVEFMRRVEGSLRELTGRLLHWNQLSRVSNGIHGEGMFACTQYFFFNVTVEVVHSWKSRAEK